MADAPPTDPPVTTPPPPTDPPPPAPPPPDPDDALGEAGRRALQAERDARKAAEKKARDTEAELEKLRTAQMSDQQRAIAEAEARGRTAATTEVAQRLAAAEIKAALTGVVPDPAAIVEDLNLGKYITADGDVDADAVKALRTKYEALAPKTPPKPDPGPGDGGHRGGPPATDPGEMSMADYIAARREGRIT